MKKYKKIFSLVGVISLLSSSIAANASVITDNVYNSKGFTSAWESSKSGTDYSYVYGYNTSFINEDYCHATHSVYNHTAALSNGNGGYESSIAGPGKTAKIEVRHSGSSVLYGIRYGYF